MSGKVLLVKHENGPLDDRAATHLAARGFTLDVRYPYAGDSLPASAEGYVGTVVYGGVQPVPEADRFPFLKDEMAWLGRCLKADVPVLGICLGAQLLAHQLGAAVKNHPEGFHEFGFYPLTVTEAGRDVMPERLHVTLSHYQTFDLPSGATLLASSSLYQNQAMRWGKNSYGFQFHPECSAAIFKRWQVGDSRYGLPGVQTKEEQDRLAALHDPQQGRWFTTFLDRWMGVTSAVAA